MFAIRKYGFRYWVVYDQDQLVAVTVYKKGAAEIVRRLSQIQESK